MGPSKCTALLLVIAMSASHVNSQACTATGPTVTYQGFIMDNYCWQTGTYKDNTTASSRKNPEVHSIMCLTDPGCVASGFAVLAPPATSGANYTIKYQLGTAGTTLALNAARAAQNATGLSRGFQMSFTGVDDGSGTLQCITATPTQSPSPPRPPPPVSGAVCWACPSQMMKTQVAMFSFLILAMATAATAPV